jgi:hypothetical protein
VTTANYCYAVCTSDNDCFDFTQDANCTCNTTTGKCRMGTGTTLCALRPLAPRN